MSAAACPGDVYGYLTLVRRETLPDGAERYFWRVDPEHLVYLGFLFEVLEGMCAYSTVTDHGERLFKTEISPDFVNDWEAFLPLLRG